MFKDAVLLPALAYKMLLMCTTEKRHYLRKKPLFKEEVRNSFTHKNVILLVVPILYFIDTLKLSEAGNTRLRGDKARTQVFGYDAFYLRLSLPQSLGY
jgi:hypothetical protein